MKDDATADIEFIREYPVTLKRLWRAMTEPVQLIQWFGPEGVYLEACEMDFRTTGPWNCTMIGKETGNSFKVSGQITHVSVPDHGKGSVGFTWAWHDDGDVRVTESHVMFVVEETASGARLTLIHRDPDPPRP